MGLLSAVTGGLARDFKALGAVTVRRSGPNPATEKVDGGFFDPWWRASVSTINVTEETALTVPSVYSAVNLIASAIAGLPIDVYQKIAGIRVPMESPLTQLLTLQPNPEMPAMAFWEQLVSHEVLYGNAYIFVVKSASQTPLELWPIEPKRIVVGRDDRNRKYYEVDGSKNRDAMIDFSAGGEIIHIANFGLDGLRGLSPVRLMKESIALTKAAELYSARFFSQDATPGGLLTSDKDLLPAQAQAISAAWNAGGGLAGSHQTRVLSNGAKWQQVSVNPEDSQLEGLRKFQVAESARIFRVPPHLIADVERSTSWGTGIEEQARNFVEFSLNPHLLRFEHALNVHFLNRQETDRYMKFNVSGLLRADTYKRFQTHAIALQNGIETPNEVRALEDLPKVPGGDELAKPQPAASSSEPAPVMDEPMVAPA